jgi:hypothetical protein
MTSVAFLLVSKRKKKKKKGFTPISPKVPTAVIRTMFSLSLVALYFSQRRFTRLQREAK